MTEIPPEALAVAATADDCRCGEICTCGADDWGEEPGDVWCCATCERIARAAGDATLAAALSGTDKEA